MRKMIVFSALLMSTAAWSEPQTTSSTPAVTNFDPNQMICQNIAETGSRLSHVRVCKTRAQWDEDHRTSRQNVERSQASRNPRQF